MLPASKLPALQALIASFGWPIFLLPPDDAIRWQQSTDGDAVTIKLTLSRPFARQVEIWHVLYESEIQFTMSRRSGKVEKISGISAGAGLPGIKGLKLRVASIDHSTASQTPTLDFHIKPPYLPGFTVALANSHFDAESVWQQ